MVNIECTVARMTVFVLSVALLIYLYRRSQILWPTIESQKLLESDQIFSRIDEIPKEALDHNSAYYGNIYKDSYGLALSEFGLSTFKRITRSWTDYFPDLMNSLKRYQAKNPSKDYAYFTRPTSSVTIEAKDIYKVGDVLVAHIQAKDNLGRNKIFGGDYFRARLVRKNQNDAVTDGVACKIQDNQDGTYTLKAPLLIAGSFTLEIYLVLSIEGISHFLSFSAMRDHHGNFYNATLDSNEWVECNYDLDIFDTYKGKSLCDYSNPRNEEAWFCSKPPSGKCHPITTIVIEKMNDEPPYDIKKQLSKIYGKVKEITGSGAEIQISSTEVKASQAYSTYLREHSLAKMFWPTGYVQKSKWISLQRTNSIESLGQSRKCFKSKIIYFLGDSTNRQIFTVAIKRFKLVRSGPDNSKMWHQPQVGQSEDPADNITIYYRAHGPPLRNLGPPDSRPYISDSINAIKVGGSNVYVVFTIGLHLMYYDGSLYVQRLQTIKEAIIRHQKMFPDTRFIVKGMNTVISPREWPIHRVEVIFHKFFQDMKHVLYLDLIDMTTVWPITTVHPPLPVLEQQCIFLFSNICHWPLN